MDNDTAPQNKHIVFVDTDKEGNTQDSFNTGLLYQLLGGSCVQILIFVYFLVKEFDAAKHFGTHPSLVNRRFNRSSLESLKKLELRGTLNEEDLKVSH